MSDNIKVCGRCERAITKYDYSYLRHDNGQPHEAWFAADKSDPRAHCLAWEPRKERFAYFCKPEERDTQ